jgi:hypothetical protein
MTRGGAATLVVLAFLLLLAGVVVLGFLTEPSAIGRMRTALIGIGVVLIAAGVAGCAAGVWLLIRRRT